MRVLILSITAGQGHHATGQAIQSELLSRGHACEMLDTFSYISPLIKESIARGYLLAASRTPNMYGRVYRMGEKLENSSVKQSFGEFANGIFASKLQRYIEEYQPDALVCTHVFSAQVVTQLSLEQHIPSFGIVTDFTMHPFWEETDLDYYVLANARLKLAATKKGLFEEKLLDFGIPIHQKFRQKRSQKEAREVLGIEDKNTMLVMSGSMGYGHVARIVEKLDRLPMDFQILSVCGNNHQAQKKIDRLKSHKKIYNYGFVDNVEVMMDAADCILTKPGGLTVSEALAKELPMILMDPIPGQEERNLEFLLNNGLAMHITQTFPVDEAVYHMLCDPEGLQRQKSLIRCYARPNAASDLADFIEGEAEKGNQ